MSRTLTTAAATEGAKTTGAFPRLILEVVFGGAVGTKLYAEEAFDVNGTTTDPRVLKFGGVQLESRGGRIDQQAAMSISLSDVDGVIRGFMDTEPGIQNKPAYVYLWYQGTTWPTDRVTIFGGILTTPMSWKENSPQWDLVIRGFEQHFNRDLGFIMNRIDFPEVDCTQCEGEIIPIPYGRPVRRVPACVIDRPGTAYLVQPLPFCGSNQVLCINMTCAQGGFTCGTQITIIIGWAGAWEAITGTFPSSSSQCMNIASRGSTFAEGQIVGFFGTGGIQYILIKCSDLPDCTGSPPTAPSRSGHIVCFQEQDGTWIESVVSNWQHEGANIVIHPKGDIDVVTGSKWKISAGAGIVPDWKVGTPVREKGTYTYAISFYPIEEVIRVEARANVNKPGGGTGHIWAQYNPIYYTVNLDDKTYNTILGRGALEPGIATVTTSFAPTQVGYDEETIWVTMNGIVEIVGGPAIENPIFVMLDILTKKYLGGLDASVYINSASFTAASTDVTTRFAFALLERTELHNVISDLAMQATVLYFWDQGRATVKKLSVTLSSGDSLLTLNESNRMRDTFEMGEIDVKQFTTEMEARFKLAIPSPQLKLARKSSEAIAFYGNKRDDLDLWAFQAPSSVAFTTEFWLSFRLHNNRTLKLTTFLNALELQPGDTVTFNITDGLGSKIIDNQLCRVTAVNHTPGNPSKLEMEKIELTVQLKLFSFVVQVDVPADDTCDQIAGQFFGSAGPNFQKLYVQSDGVNTMFVMAPKFAEIAGGGTNINNPVQTPDDPEVLINLPVDPQPPPIPIPPTVPVPSGSIELPSNFSPPEGSISPSPPEQSFSITLTGTRSGTATGSASTEGGCACGFDSFTDTPNGKRLCGWAAHVPEVGTWSCNQSWSGLTFDQFEIFNNQLALNPNRGIETMGPCGISDATISVTVCMPADGPTDVYDKTPIGGVAFRMSSITDNELVGWGALLIGDGRDEFRLYKFRGGSWEEVASCSMPVEKGSCYSVTVVACGNTIFATASGPEGGCELLFEDSEGWQIDATAHGMLGIQGIRGSSDWLRMTFDDFCIIDSCSSGSLSISPSDGESGSQSSGSAGGCGECLWKWDAGALAWNSISHTCCTDDDTCSEPGADGTVDGQITGTRCEPTA